MLASYVALFLLCSVIDSFEWFWMGSLHKNIQLMMELLKAPFLVLHFSYYTLMTFLMMLSLILLSMLMILLSIVSVIRHLICGKNLNWLLNLNLIYKALWTVARSGLLISMLGKLSWFFLTGPIAGSIDVKIDGSVLEEKYFKLLGLTFCSKLDWGSYMISIAKTASQKIRALIHSMKFLSPEVVLYLYKSTTCPWMQYCCQVWAGAPSYYYWNC